MDENLLNIYKTYSEYLTEYEYLKDYNDIPNNSEILYFSKIKNTKKNYKNIFVRNSSDILRHSFLLLPCPMIEARLSDAR